MTFIELYGTELDRELGSTSTTLFTTVRRKAAINNAQLEFVKRTECYQRQGSIAIVSGTQEYDIEATIADFLWIAAQGVSIAITSGTTVRYLEGDDLEFTSVERLNVEEPGWRGVAAGTPTKYYLRQDGGSYYLGFHPKPSISGSDTWAVVLPYVALPADMSADADEPFSLSSNPIKRLRPWHRALVHFAAYDLEKDRKAVDRSAAQLQLWELELQKYTAAMKPKNGSQVRFSRHYRAGMDVPTRRFDRRAYP